MQEFESFDPTDGFGSNIRVFVGKNQIVMIEPDLDVDSRQIWLTDKGRQYFDGIPKKLPRNHKNCEKTFQLSFLTDLVKVLYSFNLPLPSENRNSFFTVIFKNLSIETLAVIGVLYQKYSFIKLKRFENIQQNDSNAEHKDQLNSTTEKSLSVSTLCLLISTNPRYEGYYLNLNLRQRFLKGNFRCFILGSLIDLTFSVRAFLGSNISIVKLIGSGNHFICRDLTKEVNPIIVYSDELSKRKNGKHIVEAMKNMHCLTNLNRAWGNLNMLNSSISNTGTKSLRSFLPVTSKDLMSFSSLYFLNVTMNHTFNLRKITELKLLNYDLKLFKTCKTLPLFIDQNTVFKSSGDMLGYTKNFKGYYFPTPLFYANDDTYFNSEGLVKKASKIVSVGNNWEIIKSVLQHLSSTVLFLNNKDNFIVFFNASKKLSFKSFQCYAAVDVSPLSFYLTYKNNPVMFSDIYSFFKPKTLKINHTRTSYWLDDFYTGGSDLYSQNSIMLSRCAELFRCEQTNFYV